MKTITHLFGFLLFVSLLLSAQVIHAQTTDADFNDSPIRASTFEVGSYMGDNWTINLMLGIHQPQGATIRIRDRTNAVLYEQRLKKSRTVYHHKLNFKDCKPGVYLVEVSDGQQTITRRIEVVDIPAIESQRYITYSLQDNL